MGKYELLYIVHPDLESSIDKIINRVKSQITDKDGKITYEENWGKRKLAYKIRKSDTGIYILVYFEMPKDMLAKVERDLRLTEEIIRFMLLSKEEKITAKASAKTAKKAEKEEEGKEPKEEKETQKAKETREPKEEKEVKTEKPKAVKKVTKEPALSNDSGKGKPAEESEAERMKKLDEKLGAILGKEEESDK